MMVMFALGMAITQSMNPLLSGHHISTFDTNRYEAIELRLTEAPIPKSKSYKVVAEAIAIYHDSIWQPVSGSILMYIEKDSSSRTLMVDDTLWIRARPTALHEVQNPFEFNYKQYLQHHFIYNQVYVPASQWQLKAQARHHSFHGFFVYLREQMLEVFRHYGVKGQEYAVLSALVLGKTSEIDYHLMLSYASAGAVHILAVSGLHVGLIYVILAPIMRRVFPKGKFRWLKASIPIILLWIYAGITGFSPSVLRAAWMFTCFIIADTFGKESNIFNTLSASALILLCWNPYMIMEVGFQLSYLAVLGIVLLQKQLQSFYYSPIKIIQWAWSLTTVSIAAQLSTFALGLLYFHQFPNWFLISNLFVIPLSTIILYVSLAFFATLWCPPVAEILITISIWLTRWMNQAMLLVDRIPFSITQGISITIFESYLIAGITIFACYWLLWRKPQSLIPTICCASVLCFSQVVEKKNIVQHSEICIHSISGHRCITYAQGEVASIFYTDSLWANESKLRFHLKNYWDHLGVKQLQWIDLNSKESYTQGDVVFQPPYIQLGETRMLMMDSVGWQVLNYFDGDVLLFNRAPTMTHLTDEQRQRMHAFTPIVYEKISHKQYQRLKDFFGEARLRTVENGAVIIRDKKVFHFSQFY